MLNYHIGQILRGFDYVDNKYKRQALFVVSVLTAKPVFVVSVLTAKPVFTVSVGLGVFQKDISPIFVNLENEII